MALTLIHPVLPGDFSGRRRAPTIAGKMNRTFARRMEPSWLPSKLQRQQLACAG